MLMTRIAWGFCLVLALLMTVPAGPVSAQAPPQAMSAMADNTVTLWDPVGDVDLTLFPKNANNHQNASSNTQGQFDHLDITKIVFGGETDKTFQITAAFKALDPPQGTGFPFRWVTFSYGRIDWQLRIGTCNRNNQGTAAPTVGCLSFKDSSSRGYRAVRDVAGTREASTGAYTWTIDKQFVFNENRVPARFGESLRNLSATTRQYYYFGEGGVDQTGGAYAGDVAPQGGGFATQVFVFNKGSGGHGDLGLSSPDPIRVTNGEATTIVYSVDVFNHNAAPFNVQMEVKNTPADWTVRAPALLKVPGQGSVRFPVILAMPFRHDHGKTVTYTLEAHALEDPNSNAAIDLGVFWTDVPQPSGHHECPNDDTCGQWFHAAPLEGNPLPDQADAVAPFKSTWFNGIAQDPDPAATDENVPAFLNDEFTCMVGQFNPTGCKAPPEWRSSWFFPMSPQLLIGMDFDTSKTGMAKLSFMPKIPDSAAKIEVSLRYCDPTKQTGSGGQNGFQSNATCFQYSQVLARGTGTIALATNTKAYVEIPLAIDPSADLVPYKRGANIGFNIRITSTAPENGIITEPRIEFMTKQSHLHLPLVEYHDPVDQAFDELGLIRLEATDSFEKPVNPGRTTLFHFNAVNKDDIPHHLALEVQGVNFEWARIVGPQVMLVEPGANKSFTLAVRVPDSAVPQERAELFVVAQSQEESWVVALSRLRALVVDPGQQDIPDEAGKIDAANAAGGSPGFDAVLLVVAMAGVAVAAGRRRVG